MYKMIKYGQRNQIYHKALELYRIQSIQRIRSLQYTQRMLSYYVNLIKE